MSNGKNTGNVTLTREAFDAVREALNQSDRLVSLTISGESGGMRAALDTARALSAVDKHLSTVEK